MHVELMIVRLRRGPFTSLSAPQRNLHEQLHGILYLWSSLEICNVQQCETEVIT